MTLAPPPIRTDRGILRREQVLGGLPVLGRGVVTWGALAIHDVERALPRDVRPVLSRSDAVMRARPFSRAPVDEDDARLVVHAGRRGGTLAWLIAPRRTHGLPTAPRVVVDATSGRVLEARDQIKHASVFTYPENPTRTPSPALLPLPFATVGDRLSSSDLVARSCVDHGGTRSISLGGAPRVIRVCGLEQVAVASGTGDFVEPPRSEPRLGREQADAFAEASAFFHAARILEYFRILGGGTEEPRLSERPLDLVTSLRIAPGLLEGDFDLAGRPDAELVSYPGAFFLPGAGASEGETFRALYGVTRGTVWFGQGTKVDFAYDGDVVAHEVTHALIDATLHVSGWRVTEEGISAEPEAIGEAIADYFAAASTNDPVVGEYVATESAAATAALRSIDGDDACPRSITGEPHGDSRVLSGALWRTRRTLDASSRNAFDAAVYRALSLSPGRRDLGFEELAVFLRAALQAELPSAEPLLASELVRSGILPRCSSIVTLVPDAPLRAPVGWFAAPGTDATSEVITPGILQLRVEVPPGTSKIGLVFAARRVSPPLFGREGTPFQPVVLASWDRPIRWSRDAANEALPDVSARVTPEGEASRVAELDVPAGVRVAYLQIANEGEGDGAYDGLTVSFTAAVPGGDIDAGAAPEAPVSSAPTAIGASGSGCAMAPSRGPIPIALLFGVAALGFRRRRRV
ncbi:hypothetical protein AKJ09_02194 [Labilithrix luteola]|uniref:FTP domain-containing protein n=1 Tax=Labilithrix luteola TaxID=1391654 RepID=A0A0K1PPR3_9BACT|nr:hypothetical protein AKJ09_02194 [Labilithrix luteola]